jgi:hypothetical protein
MAIAPIDLQTLFTQLDKAGKTHLSHREGQPLQNVIQTIQSQKKTEELINQVNEAQNTGEGTEKVKERGQGQHEGKKRKKRRQEEQEDEKKVSVLSDPSLGKNIDISL